MGAAPAKDTVLLGKYRVEEVLGEGGMGVVCKAHHLILDQPVAIKFLLPQMTANPAIVTRFLREAQSAVKLRGEHVARVIDVGKLDDGSPYMVMEYLDGADLGAIIKHYGAQAPEVCADLLLQACEGMAEAHARGIVHRDVKPSNFYITRRPDGTPLLKILDFGISTGHAGQAVTELTRTQSIIGTPAYMAPEQMRSAKTADQRSDIWSMGVVLFQLLAGYRPFESEIYPELCLKVGMDPPAPLDVDIDDEYRQVVLKCLEKNADNRYQHVGELAWSLVPFATDPHLARGSAERTCRILNIMDGQATVKVGVTKEMEAAGIVGSPPPKTPPPITQNPRVVRRASQRMAVHRPPTYPGDADSYPGQWDDSSAPGLPLLSQGPIPTDNIPTGQRSTPSSVSAGSGQVSMSRSMPVVAPSRRGWVIGTIAIVLIAAGGWWISQQDLDGEPDTPAQPAAGPAAVEGATPATTPTPTPTTTPGDPPAAVTPTPTPPAPTDTKPTDTEPTDTETTDTKPTDTKPTDTKPTDTETTDTKPTDTKPTDAKATQQVGKSTGSRIKRKKSGGKKPGPPSGGDIFGSRE